MYYAEKDEVVRYLGKKVWLEIEKKGIPFQFYENEKGILTEDIDFKNFSINDDGATWYEGVTKVEVANRKLAPQIVWWLKKKSSQFVSWWSLIPWAILKWLSYQFLGRHLGPLAKYPFCIFLEFQLKEIYKKNGFRAATKAVLDWLELGRVA